jgi:hypothetical protein
MLSGCERLEAVLRLIEDLRVARLETIQVKLHDPSLRRRPTLLVGSSYGVASL